MTFDKIRPVEETDRNTLPSASYSKIDLFLQCNHRYKLKYVDRNFDDSKAIALNVGSICHKVLELKGRAKMAGEKIDYQMLKRILYDGCEEETAKGSEKIWGVDKIKTWFFEDWNTPDNKSGMTYDEKMKLFLDKVVPGEMEDEEWKVIGCEVPFEFVYDDRVIIHGFIDRVDRNTNEEIRVVDYKTSKAVYDATKLITPLQMAIYGMACELLYGQVPIEYMYRFILIDQEQYGCSLGYEKRAVKKLDKTFDSIQQCKETKEYVPSPSPLCYWCSFSQNNPSAEFKGKCPYYSLWTPDNKSFSVNQTYDPLRTTVTRKLIF